MDEFVAPVAVLAGEAHEFSRTLNDGTLCGCVTDHRDASAASKFEQPFVSKQPKSPEDCVGVDAQDGGKVPSGGESLTRMGFSLGNRPPDLGRDLVMQGNRLSPIHLDSYHGDSDSSTITDTIPSPTVAERQDQEAEALIREARRHQRRRRLLLGSFLSLMVAGVVAGVLITSGPTSPKAAQRAAYPQPVVLNHLQVSSVRFSGSFVPQQIVADGGRIWILGSTEPRSYKACAIEGVDPATLKTSMYPIPACAVDITAGQGHLFLATESFVPGTAATEQLRIEAFNTATHSSTMFEPVDMTLIGSAIAHQTLAYGAGTLWLYGYGRPSRPQVVQISTSTGAVITATNAVPAIGGIFPAVVADAGGLWLGGGPGGAPNLEFIPRDSSTPKQLYDRPQSAIQWLSTDDNLVWASVQILGSEKVQTRLLAFDTSGKLVVDSPPEQTGEFPLVNTSGSTLWTIGVGGKCSTQQLIAVDKTTGASRAVATLKTSIEPCLYGASGSQLASANGSVFVLDPTQMNDPPSLLYRVHS
jgi:hypothetical protein